MTKKNELLRTFNPIGFVHGCGVIVDGQTPWLLISFVGNLILVGD